MEQLWDQGVMGLGVPPPALGAEGYGRGFPAPAPIHCWTNWTGQHWTLDTGHW